MLALQKNKYKYWIASIILMILGATRAASVGRDIFSYSMEFNSIQMEPSTWGHYMPQFEIGFLGIMLFFKKIICSTPIYFIHLLFFITFSCFVIFIKKNSRYSAMVLFFMFALSYYFSMYNIMRQELAFALICCFSLPLLLNHESIEKKITYYNVFLFFTLVCLISFLFHNSQVVLLMCIPLCLFYKKKCFETKCLVVYIVLSMIFSMTIAQKCFSWMNSIAPLLTIGNSHNAGYMVYSENMGLYSTTANIFNSIVAVYIVIMYRFKKNPMLLLFVFGVVLQNSLTPISWIFARMADSFLFFKIFVFADLWYEIRNRREKLAYRVFIILYSLIMFNNRLIKDHFLDVVPYVNHYLEMVL